MANIAFNKLEFTSTEEVIITGTVDDVTATSINYGGNEYPLTNSSFSLNMGQLPVGSYELAVTIVDGDSAGEVISQVLVITSLEVPQLTEEELAELAIKNEVIPDYVHDYVPYTETNTDIKNEDIYAGSMTGFWPIETTAQKFPERRNIQTTHPDPSMNGSDGLFNGLGRQADLTDEKSDSERLVTRSGGQGSPIPTSGFTL